MTTAKETQAPTEKAPDIAKYAEVFRALGDPVRAEIIRQAALTPELACTELEQALPVSKSTISYHVRILYHAELLEIRKDGRFYFYRLREDVVTNLLPGFIERMRSTDIDNEQLDSRIRVRRKAAKL